MLMECVQGGELYSRIHTSKDGALDSETVLFYAANMVVALRHLHAKDIVYRDLKVRMAQARPFRNASQARMSVRSISWFYSLDLYMCLPQKYRGLTYRAICGRLHK